jgi:serine O-acetyltransferase
MGNTPLTLAMPSEKLRALLFRQIDSLFLLDENAESEIVDACWQEALDRTTYAFSFCKNKYYQRDGQVFFNPLHTAQYGIFLYYLAHTVWNKHGAIALCDKLYALNKVINSLDLYFQIEMPEVFFMDHPVGTVLGRAQYGRYFSFSQNCTVGNNKGIYPVVGENVKMMSYSRIIGKCTIGNNVVIASGTFIKDQDIPDCSLVFGESPNLIIKARPIEYFESYLP